MEKQLNKQEMKSNFKTTQVKCPRKDTLKKETKESDGIENKIKARC